MPALMEMVHQESSRMSTPRRTTKTVNRGAACKASLLSLGALSLAVTLVGCGSSGSSGSSSPPPPVLARGTVTEYSIPTANAGAAGIVAGPDNNLWFLESNTGTNKVAKITTTGVITEYPLSTTNAFPEEIVSGPDGNLWYVDETNDLGKVTTAGAVQLYTATNAGEITVGPDSNFWVLEFNGGNVDVYSTAGALLNSYPSNFNPSNLQGESITTGPDGNLWFDTFSGDNVVSMTT